MKKTALVAAVVALFCATPAIAQPTAYVGLDYKNVDNLDDSESFELEGAIGFSGPSGWGFQVDASIANGEYDTVALDIDTYNVTGHAFYTGASGWRLGGVVGVSNAELGPLEFEDVSYGIEGTYDFGTQTVVSGSATFGETDLIGTDLDTWNVDAGVDFYAMPNLRFGANAGFGNLEAPGGDFDSTSFGLDAEWQPWAMPVSFTAGYSTYEDDILTDSDSFRIGARWSFGGGTLQERDEATPFDTQTSYAQRFFAIR